MALDPRIALGVQSPQIQSPLDAMTQIAQLQQAREATEARRLAAEEAREKKNRQAKYESALQRATTVGPDGRVTIDIPSLLPHLDTETILKVQEAVDANATRAAQLETATLTREQKVAERFGALARPVKEAKYDPTAYGLALTAARAERLLTQAQVDRMLNEAAYDPAAIQQHVDNAIARVPIEKPAMMNVGPGGVVFDPVTRQPVFTNTPQQTGAFTLSPGATRFGPNGEVIATVPSAAGAGGGFTLSPGAVRYGPNGEVIASRPAAPGSGDAPLIQVTRTDPVTGEQVTELVPRVPGEVARRPPPEPTKAQYDAGLFAGRLAQASPILTKLETAITGMNLVSYEFQLGAKPTFQSATMQSYMQAARNFINAVLRRESGAVISPEEFAEARQQYLPQPGDTAETLQQKKANRDYVFSSLQQQAGPAYLAPVTPPPPGGGPPAPDTARVRVVGPNGQTGTVPAGTTLPPGWRTQ